MYATLVLALVYCNFLKEVKLGGWGTEEPKAQTSLYTFAFHRLAWASIQCVRATISWSACNSMLECVQQYSMYIHVDAYWSIMIHFRGGVPCGTYNRKTPIYKNYTFTLDGQGTVHRVVTLLKYIRLLLLYDTYLNFSHFWKGGRYQKFIYLRKFTWNSLEIHKSEIHLKFIN